MGEVSMRRLALACAVLVATVTLAGAGGVPASAAPGDAAREAALRAALETKRLAEVSFQVTKLEDVLKYLRIATGLNFAIKRLPVQKAGIDVDMVTATITLEDVSVSTLLGLVLDPHGLVAKPVGNVVMITTLADALGPPVLVLYPITQLTWTKTDFHGPTLDLTPSGFVEPEEPEKAVEDDPMTDPSHIVDLVKQMVTAPWDTEGWTITATKQLLSVKAPRSVQHDVARAVRMLEALK
jgi:hypothetical protein